MDGESNEAGCKGKIDSLDQRKDTNFNAGWKPLLDFSWTEKNEIMTYRFDAEITEKMVYVVKLK